MGDWKEAYGIIGEARAKGLRSAISAKTIAETEFRKQTSNSPIVAPYTGEGHDTDKSAGERAGEIGKSIGKRLIDVLSVVPYAMNNVSDDFMDAVDDGVKAGQEGDIGGQLLGLAKGVASPLTGLSKGSLGAFGNDNDLKKTGSDTVRRIQDEYLPDVDPDSKASKITATSVGLASDIFLDPTTYLTLGAAPVIKGAITGSRLGSKAAKKAVDEAAEKGRAAGLSEEQIQKQILDHPNAQLYDNRASGMAKGAKKEYGAWKESEFHRKQAKAARKADKGNVAEGIARQTMGPNVKDELMSRPQSSFVHRDATNEAQGVPAATTTNETATRASMDWEARRALREAQEGTATAVGKAEDEAVGMAVDTKGKEIELFKPETTAAKLVESIQGSPVAVGKTDTKAAKVANANAQLVNTLGSSRAQEILDVLNKIQPKNNRYSKTTMNRVRKEYAARPSTVKQKNSLGPRSAQPDYIAPTAKAPAPVAKERSTAFVSGKNRINPVELHKVLMKLPSSTMVSLKGRSTTYAPQIARELRMAMEKNDRAKVQGILDEFPPLWFNNKGKAAVAGAAPKPVAKTVDEEVDEIIPDNPNEELFEEIDVPNINAVTEQELVEKFGIAPDDAGRLLDEIEEMVDDLDMSGNITNATVKGVSAYIQGKHIPAEELDLLKKLTGKDTKGEVAAEIRLIMNAHKKEINGLKNPSKEKVQVAKTEEEIAAQAASVSELATAIAKSPNALNGAVGQERLLKEFSRTTSEITEKYSKKEVVGDADEIIRFGEEAAANMHAYQSKHGAKKTARGYDVNSSASKAWMRGSYNSHAGTTLHRSIIDGLKKMHHPTPLDRVPTGIKATQYMDMLKVADAKSRAMGIQPFQSFASSIDKGAAPINLSLHDILSSLKPEVLRDALFFKGRTYGFDTSQITGAVETFMRGKAAGMDNVKLAKEIEEWFTKPGAKVGLGDKQRGILEKATETKKAAGKRDVEAYGKSFARKLINPESTVYSHLTARMLLNSAQHASAVGKHVEDLTEPAIERIASMPTGRAFIEAMEAETASLKKQFTPEEWDLAQTMLETNVQALKKLTETERQMIDLVNKASKASKSTPAAEAKAMDDAAKILPNGKPAHTEYGNTKTKKLETVPAAVHRAEVKQAELAEAEIRAIAPEGAEEFSIIGASIANDMVRKMHPIKSYFVPSLGIQGEGVYRAMNTGLHTVAHLQNNFHEQLLKHMSQYGNAQLTRDFKTIQEAVATNTGRLQLESQSAKDLYNVIDTMFAVSGKNVFEANSIGASHFNALADAANLHSSWRFKEGASPNENAKLWTQWEGIENVPDFLSRIHNVAVRSSQDISIAASFTKNFGVIGKRDGYVKIGRRDEANDKTIGMYELINRDMYYPIEVARDFAAVDKLMRDSRSVSGKTAIGKFVINVMDPVTNALKASQTTVRPGHWVLSVVGDTLRNHIAGVNSITPYKQAIRVLKAGGHDMDGLGTIEKYRTKARSLNNPEIHGEGIGIKVNIGGKFQNISDESVARLMRQVVNLPPHSGGVMEDVLEPGMNMNRFGDGIKKATEFVTNNQGLNGKLSLNKLASQRDNWMRTTLALDYIQKGKFKNIDEMKAGMEDFVTKWAPTSTDFTAREAKYARRAFLYYTWLRGITPRVVETMLNKPGITTLVPKAQYAVAQANGLDPQSFGNPFPEDGLYPDYYYNSILGPQWKDDMGGEWGINPSHPSVEVINNFGMVDPTNPAKSAQGMGAALLGMSTPFAKMPIEMAMGAQSNGVPIEDRSQYMLDNLGGSWASTLSRATGKTINQNGIVNRTDSAYRGNPEQQAEHAKLQGINFMTGAQLKDYQSDSAIRSAKYGLQERMRHEKEEGMR